jgi:hypothetical protein
LNLCAGFQFRISCAIILCDRLVTIPPVRGQAADRWTGRSEFKFGGRALSQRHVMKLTNWALQFQ